MNRKLITTLCLSTLLTVSGCSSAAKMSSSSSINDSVSSTADTTKPVITLKSESVTVELGANYSAKENIESVTDDKNGELEYAKKAVEGKAYYLIDESKVDLSKAGTYKANVTAIDKAGNSATKEFNVTVKEKTTASTKKTDTTETNKSTSKSTDETNKKSSSDSTNNTTSKKTDTSSSTKKQTSNSSNSSTNNNSTASNNSSSSNNTTQQTCKNVHHDATGHYETQQKLITAEWDEYVDDGVKIQCTACGATFSTSAEYLEHVAYYRNLWSEQYNQTMDPNQTDKSLLAHGSSTDIPAYHYIHHDAVYETTQVWVEDTAAYDETVCS